MKKLLSLSMLCFVLFSSTKIWAQKISGTVTSEGAARQSVSVTARPSGKGTTTNSEGKYSLTLPAGTYKITFSETGFTSITESVTVAEGEDKTLDIVLTASNDKLDDIVVVGTRSLPRSSANSPLPVDNFDSKSLKSTGQLTFDKALQYRVPSFNTVQTPVNDATSLLDPYEIRNMGPSRTLILINGKRKNMSSLVYIQTSPGRGETGADISAIPQDAIKRVEILRDGASAQYGSDAIAGVMNIILKDRYEYGTATINAGVTSKGDGEMLGVSVNNAANFGSKGFVNYTMNFSQTQLANRPGVVSAKAEADGGLGFGYPSFSSLSDFQNLGSGDTDYDGLPINPNGSSATLANMNTWNTVGLVNSTNKFLKNDVEPFLAKHPDGGNINGSPKTTAAKFLVNAGIPIGDNNNSEVYFNAAYVYKKVNSFANYRTPYWKSLASNPSLALLGSGVGVTTGYVPTFEGDLGDYNATAGFKTESNGWKNDVSITFGGNRQLYSVNNTVNFGLGLNTPISFKPGGFNFSHVVGNIDLAKQISDKVSVGFGSEFRNETFTIIGGDTASYVNGGANSFPGFAYQQPYRNSRTNLGAYADLGIDVTKDFLVNLTGRFENYSSFGNAFVWKASTRYKLADDKITVRGSISTGFRAPSLHQVNLQLAQASFLPGGAIQLEGILNNASVAAKALNLEALKAEKSTNFTFGLGVNPTKKLGFTVDFYSIKVVDRIILSSKIGGTPSGTSPLDNALALGGVKRISFFTNGIDTRTTGVDFVGFWKGIAVGEGKLNLSLAANFTLKNELIGGLTAVKTPQIIKNGGYSIFDATQEALLLSSRPKSKVILGLDYNIGKVQINLNNTLFGKTTFHQDGIDKNLNTEFIPKVVTDLGASFNFTKKLAFQLNINNLLNVIPKWKFVALNPTGETILKDPNAVFVQTNLLTFNGRYSMVTYDGSHFSQLGTTFTASLTFKF
jgi:iron complex outermembrane recepter protein